MSLSVKKILSDESVSYLLDHARDRHEEYLAAEGTGYWLRNGIAVLRGAVDASDFRKLADGFDPIAGSKLRQNAGERGAVKGFNIAFSCPKDLSIIWALGDDNVRETVEAAQRAAVESALDHMRREVIKSRSGHGGTEQVDVSRIAVALFEHKTARPVDEAGRKDGIPMPQLHTHAALLNVAQDSDGKCRTIDAQRLFAWRAEAESMYHSNLAREIEQRLGVRAIETQGKRGFKLDLPCEVFAPAIESFSQRRAQILANAGGKEALDSMSSALEQKHVAKDRAGKRDEIEPEQLQRMWREMGKEFGLDRSSISNMLADARGRLHQEPTPAKLTDDLRAFARGRAYATLTTNESTFSEPQFRREFTKALVGRCNDIAAVERASREELSELVDTGEESKHERLYTTREQLSLELDVLWQSRELSAGRAVSLDIVEDEIAKAQRNPERPLTDEQARAVRHLLLAHDERDPAEHLDARAPVGDQALAVFEGPAGSGKSTTLSVVKSVCDRAGLRLLGTAISHRAAGVVKQETGAEYSTAIAQLAEDLRTGKLKLSERDRIVVDEASMLNARDANTILAAARKAGSGVWFAGDRNQLSPVAGSAIFSSVVDKLSSARINTVRRQTVDWQREAGLRAAEGDAAGALRAYREAGKLHICRTREETVRTAAALYTKQRFDNHVDQHVGIVAATRATARAVTAEVRTDLSARGIVDRSSAVAIQLTDGDHCWKSELAPGDRIAFRRTAKRARVAGDDAAQGLVNRLEGTVTSIDLGGSVPAVKITLDRGGEYVLRLDGDKKNDLFNNDKRAYQLEHCTARTVHAAQGATDQREVIVLENNNKESLYVALTRHREDADVVINAEPYIKSIQSRSPDWRPAHEISDDEIVAEVARVGSTTGARVAAVDYLAAHGTLEEALTQRREEVLAAEAAAAAVENTKQASLRLQAETRLALEGLAASRGVTLSGDHHARTDQPSVPSPAAARAPQRASHKPDLAGYRPPPPAARHGLRDMSQLSVVHAPGRLESVLQGDVPRQLERSDAGADRDVRRADVDLTDRFSKRVYRLADSDHECPVLFTTDIQRGLALQGAFAERNENLTVVLLDNDTDPLLEHPSIKSALSHAARRIIVDDNVITSRAFSNCEREELSEVEREVAIASVRVQ
ncbi:relaxase domain-containing protein [Niveibacterium sp. 24ML]|uniref:MobF family relaxase n=1 Tax=Niveibacterium sp. 24ML TaxID=2985512 RepID=UPI0022720637|nr:MobF family relaxase [Niveibacterium sp. 24ML]MCX9156495.1 relaxase domain-containing protein [Niveibacterium sp. 24ML]